MNKFYDFFDLETKQDKAIYVSVISIGLFGILINVAGWIFF